MATKQKFWYMRFRTAAYLNVLGSMLWTVVMVIPLNPFSNLPPIVVGGGPGTWLLLGYLLYPTVGVGGIAGLSAFLFMIETHERRVLNGRIMLTGLALLDTGVLLGCVLLGMAGAAGGYTLTIQHVSVQAARSVLRPYVNPITAASLAAVAGAGLSIYGMATAARPTRTGKIRAFHG